MAMPPPSREGKSGAATLLWVPNPKNTVHYQSPLMQMKRYRIQQKGWKHKSEQKKERKKKKNQKLSLLDQLILVVR